MEKLISALKACQRGECKDCPRNWLPDCDSDLYKDAAEAIEKIIDGKEKAKHIMEYAEKRMLEENEIGNEPLTRY